MADELDMLVADVDRERAGGCSSARSRYLRRAARRARI
jgi:hypothetical protein